MDLTCCIGGIIGGSIMYFILHGVCTTKRWLKNKKNFFDCRLGRQ